MPQIPTDVLTHRVFLSNFSGAIPGRTGMYQNLPDCTHSYGQHFGISKAEKKGSSNLPLSWSQKKDSYIGKWNGASVVVLNKTQHSSPHEILKKTLLESNFF